jgi:hypothetical protein
VQWPKLLVVGRAGLPDIRDLARSPVECGEAMKMRLESIAVLHVNCPSSMGV